jgi:hypothetical protein
MVVAGYKQWRSPAPSDFWGGRIGSLTELCAEVGDGVKG